MLDENLPTYRFRPSAENPLHTLLYYTHNGSEPTADFLIKRPAAHTAPNQYALGLFDIQYASVLYAEILVEPEWSQPTLSAAEVRANGGQPVSTPLTPSHFSVDLYNPDQTIQIKYQSGSWSKDSWEFEVPEKSFKLPTRSKIDQDGLDTTMPELIPKINFRWKRDGRVNRDMTCFMTGKTVDGKKNKEPDITVALFKANKEGGSVAVYEPNMRRVDVEDRKGLEVVLLLSAEVIRDLYLSPKQDPFNTAGAPPPNTSKTHPNRATTSGPAVSSAAAMSGASMSAGAGAGAAMSGALANTRPSAQHPNRTSPSPDARQRAEADVERRRHAAQADDQRARDQRLQREQEEIKRMLEREEREEAERRRREQTEREKLVNRETEALLKKYGKQPDLPPRPGGGGGDASGGGGAAAAAMSGGAGGWLGPRDDFTPAQPPRPKSVDPSAGGGSNGGVRFQEPYNANGGGGGARKKLGNLLSGHNPYNGAPGASASGFFGGNGKSEEDKKKKMKKKRSTHF